MSMINARGTTNGSAYAMWSVMLYGTCKQTDHGCTSCPTSMLSLRSQPLSSALLRKNKTREQHECTNLMHSDLDRRCPQDDRSAPSTAYFRPQHCPTYLHLLTMCSAKAQSLGRQQRREGWLPSRLCRLTRDR